MYVFHKKKNNVLLLHVVNFLLLLGCYLIKMVTKCDDKIPNKKSSKNQHFRLRFTAEIGAGNPISILDGIFMAIKDDIDCYPHPSKGA